MFVPDAPSEWFEFPGNWYYRSVMFVVTGGWGHSRMPSRRSSLQN